MSKKVDGPTDGSVYWPQTELGREVLTRFMQEYLSTFDAFSRAHVHLLECKLRVTVRRISDDEPTTTEFDLIDKPW